MGRLTGVLGILAILLFAYLFSTNRKAIRLKTVVIGLALQFIFAVLVLRVGWGERVIAVAGDAVTRLLDYSFEGSQFVFGPLGVKHSQYGFFFAFQVLPIIIFIAAFFAILYHFGVMQFIIRQLAKVMMRFMGASGVESMDVAASIFMGQTEAPLTIRPYLPTVTQSELMVIMTAGMAHISGAVMGAYIAYGIEARHLLAAVIMTAPGTIVIAKMLVPETEKPLTAGTTKLEDIEFERQTKQCARCRSQGHYRRPSPGAQCRRNADFLPRADRVDRRHSRRHAQSACCARIQVVSRQAGNDLRRHLRAHRVAHRRSLARLPFCRQPARNPHGAE